MVDLRGLSGASLSGDPNQLISTLLDHYATSTYDELLQVFVEETQVGQNFVQHWKNQFERGPRFVSMFLSKSSETSGEFKRSAALEIGCGFGAALIELAETFDYVIGIEPYLPGLILARKKLEEKQISNVILVQAFGQRIPFAQESIDFVLGINVLEHVFELDAVVKESYRILRTDGRFVADSRNRFDLFLPEPHVGVRWVGLLPRRWAKTYVRWRTGKKYEKTLLLSYFDLRRAFGRQFGQDGYKIRFPELSAYGYSGKMNKYLLKLEQIGFLANLVFLVFPSLLVVARKSDS